jgi:hypothetical protein
MLFVKRNLYLPDGLPALTRITLLTRFRFPAPRGFLFSSVCIMLGYTTANAAAAAVCETKKRLSNQIAEVPRSS